MHKKGLTSLVLISVLAFEHVSRADSTVSNSPSADTDIVKLRNGGFFRGVIVEAVPGGQVKIRTADGSFREIPSSDVTYAGPFQGAAPSSMTNVPTTLNSSDKIKLTLLSSEQGSSFQLDVGSSVSSQGFSAVHYEPLCAAAPCTVAVSPGALRLRFTTLNNGSIAMDPLLLKKDATVSVRWVSRRWLRSTGWATLVVGTLGSLALMAFETGDGGADVERPYAGLGLLALTLPLAGLVMITRGDKVETAVAP